MVYSNEELNEALLGLCNERHDTFAHRANADLSDISTHEIKTSMLRIDEKHRAKLSKREGVNQLSLEAVHNAQMEEIWQKSRVSREQTVEIVDSTNLQVLTPAALPLSAKNSKRQASNAAKAICYCCGTHGHYAITCPRRAEAICNFCSKRYHLEVACVIKKKASGIHAQMVSTTPRPSSG